MRSLAIVALMVAAACVGGCTSGSTPATAPSTTAPAPSTTTTILEPETTSTTRATTTTLDRLTEIQSIFEDLERRRLEAIYSGDVEAFTALFADTPYLEESLVVFDLVSPGEPPSIGVEILEVLRDDPECLAAWAVATVQGVAVDPVTTVLTPQGGGWAYAYVSSQKGGWLCDGSHPLSQG